MCIRDSLYTANSIWYKDSDENFVPADDFLKLNAEFYQADIFASFFHQKPRQRYLPDKIQRLTSENQDVYKRQQFMGYLKGKSHIVLALQVKSVYYNLSLIHI